MLYVICRPESFESECPEPQISIVVQKILSYGTMSNGLCIFFIIIYINYHSRIVLMHIKIAITRNVLGVWYQVLGHNPPDMYPPTTYPKDIIIPPGHLPSGHLPPGTYTPWDIYPLDTYPPDLPPGYLSPRTYNRWDIHPLDRYPLSKYDLHRPLKLKERN